MGLAWSLAGSYLAAGLSSSGIMMFSKGSAGGSVVEGSRVAVLYVLETRKGFSLRQAVPFVGT